MATEKGSGGKEKGSFHQHGPLLKHFGFTKISETKGPNPSNPKIKNATLSSKWWHPNLGTIEIDHLKHIFIGTGFGTAVVNAVTGKNNAALEQYLVDKKIDKKKEQSEKPKFWLPPGSSQIAILPSEQEPPSPDIKEPVHVAKKAKHLSILDKPAEESKKAEIIKVLEKHGYQKDAIYEDKYVKDLPDSTALQQKHIAYVGDGYPPTVTHYPASGSSKHFDKPEELDQHLTELNNKKTLPPPYGLAEEYKHHQYGITYKWDPASELYVGSNGKTHDAGKMKWMVKNKIAKPIQGATASTATETPEVKISFKPIVSEKIIKEEALAEFDEANFEEAKKEQKKQDTTVATAYKYAGAASELGGAHSKYFFTKGNEKYLFKPSETIGGQADPIFAHADEAASKVAAKVRPTTFIQAETVNVEIPGKGSTFGSIQKLIPVNQLAGKINFAGINPEYLTQEDISGLQQEHVLDWLISNHDAHGTQFIRTIDGKIYGIDKSQAFKFFPHDELSLTYHPNKVEKPPYYNQFFTSAKAGNIKLDIHAAAEAIHKAQAIPDTAYKSMLAAYAAARYKSSDGANTFLEQAVARKNNLQKEMENFYGMVLGQKNFKFPDYIPKKPVGQYVAPPEKVSVEMHQLLTDYGYIFKAYGAKSGYPKYKDEEGKTVYVTGEKSWEYYPMGSTSMNSYGSTTGEGLSKLNATLNEPFEKPTPPSYTYDYGSGKLLPEAKEAWENLADEPFKSIGEQTLLTDGSVTGGKPFNYAKKPSYTEDEKEVITDYKQSGYSSINDFLYSSKSGHSYLDTKVKNLDSAMKKTVTNLDLTLYRGLGRSKYAHDIKNELLMGGVVHVPKCFQSCSTRQSFAHDWASSVTVLKIHVAKGTPCIIPTHVTISNASEDEIILDRNIIYKVNKIYKSGGKFYAEVTAEMGQDTGVELNAFQDVKISAAKFNVVY